MGLGLYSSAKALAAASLIFTQKVLAVVAYAICKLFVRQDHDLWVVGVDETCNNVFLIGQVFDNSYTVNLTYGGRYVKSTYDFDLTRLNVQLAALIRIFYCPILLGYLANRATGFFYIGRTGFLKAKHDGRRFEFSFLKKRGRKIALIFCGSEIRSCRMSIEHAKEHNLEVIATYQTVLFPHLLGDAHEQLVQALARSADDYADWIINAPVDQITYIKRDVEPFIYIYPDEKFARNDAKFDDLSRPKIVHAPSSPFIKGTQIIRAAIRNLQERGYAIEYVEVIGLPNHVVLEHFATAHIVINELYAFVPGLVGVEAMASHCAVITSADAEIETTLPDGSNDAWLRTRHWELFDHLKLLLDESGRIKPLADRGYDWAFEHCRFSRSKAHLRRLLQIDD